MAEGAAALIFAIVVCATVALIIGCSMIMDKIKAHNEKKRKLTGS